MREWQRKKQRSRKQSVDGWCFIHLYGIIVRSSGMALRYDAIYLSDRSHVCGPSVIVKGRISTASDFRSILNYLTLIKETLKDIREHAAQYSADVLPKIFFLYWLSLWEININLKLFWYIDITYKPQYYVIYNSV